MLNFYLFTLSSTTISIWSGGKEKINRIRKHEKISSMNKKTNLHSPKAGTNRIR